jgi:hypothetical protein
MDKKRNASAPPAWRARKGVFEREGSFGRRGLSRSESLTARRASLKARVVLPLLAVTALLASAVSGSEPGGGPSFEERVRAQRAIEEVYHRHRTGTKLPFEEAVPAAVLRAKVVRYLRESVALERIWKVPVTAEALARELERMARHTRFPGRLEELYEALGRDPRLVLECLVRPVYVRRLSRNFFAFDRRIHEGSFRQALALRERLLRGEAVAGLAGVQRTVMEGEFDQPVSGIGALPPGYLLPEPGGGVRAAASGVGGSQRDESTTSALACTPDDTWDNGILGRIAERRDHTAVWTGSEMIVWGGLAPFLPTNTGGRYDPVQDRWVPTSLSGAPDARYNHTAVWAAGEMVVWAGWDLNYVKTSGGRYDPVLDRWKATSTVDAPLGRADPVAVWTGDFMIVWGGENLNNLEFDTGGRYVVGHSDSDLDGVADPCDCGPADGGSFALPAEVTRLALRSDKQTLVWDSSAPSAGSGTVHDVVRGRLGELPVGSGTAESCLASGVPEATV